MRICYIDDHKAITTKVLAEALSRLGHELVDPVVYIRTHKSGREIGSPPDLLLGMFANRWRWIRVLMRLFHRTPIINFNWDVYEWCWDPAHSRDCPFDPARYGDILRRSLEIWVPSDCTARRATQWYGDLPPMRKILGCIPIWEPDTPVRDGRFFLNSLRRIPDRHQGLLESVCKSLGYTVFSTGRHAAWDGYRSLAAECTAIVSPLHELSTGGLSALEAHALGKPVIMSDSPWHGGRDYFGDRAIYFRDGDPDDLARVLRQVWECPPRLDPDECRGWVQKHYHPDVMARQIHARLTELFQ
jgi:glycosyltransferase involved in cell wall biosynthesis